MLDQLRAAPLELSGLVAALQRGCDALGFRTGAAVIFTRGTLPDSRLLPPGAPEALLRVGQEALANVTRHARATQAKVRLDTVRNALQLQVIDNGAGFDPAAEHAGMGLANIRERARLLDGEYEVLTRRGQGTTITFSVPLMPAVERSRLRTAAVHAAALAAVSFLMVVRTQSVVGTVVALLAAFHTFQLIRLWHRTPAESVGK